MLRVEAVDGGFGGLRLVEEAVDPPYIKEYDLPGEESPENWAEEFDLTNWGFLLAEENGQPLGGAAIAYDTPGVYMLERRRDLAVLWDIRVLPARERGRKRSFWGSGGLGANGCRLLKCETGVKRARLPLCSPEL
jgi:hypothetical protein